MKFLDIWWPSEPGVLLFMDPIHIHHSQILFRNTVGRSYSLKKQ